MKRVVITVVLMFAGACESATEAGAGAPAPATSPERSAGALAEKQLAARCERDDAAACDVLGAMYLVGKDVAADEARALELRRRALGLFARACQGGDAAACERAAPVASPGSSGPSAITPTVTVKLPHANDAVVEQRSLLVRLASDGQIYVNGSPRAAGELESVAAPECIKNARAEIRADAEVPHGAVVGVLDQLRQAGCHAIAFGVKPP